MNESPAATVSTSGVEEPQFIHDCDTCAFLGRFTVKGAEYGGTYDLYHHPAPASHPLSETVVARFGDSPEAFYSGLHFAAPYVDIAGISHAGIAPLVEAKRRVPAPPATA